MSFAVSSLTAQSIDITPQKFKFSEQPIGRFIYDGLPDKSYETNAPAKYAPAKTSEGGYTYLMGWGNFYAIDGVDKGNTEYMRAMTNIVDLGGEVGKVLCFKGHECGDDLFPYGIKPDASLLNGDIEWPAIAFYLGNTIDGTPYTKKNYKARFSITWRLVIPENEYSDEDDAFTLRINDYSINTKPFTNVGDQLAALSYETEFENTWCTQEADFSFYGDEEQVPLLVKFSFGKFTTRGTLLIKEMKVTLNPEGEPTLLAHQELNMAPTSIKELENIPSYNFFVEENNIVINHLSGEKIAVYNSQGMLIKQIEKASTNEVISIQEKGVYILQIDNKNYKVII